MIEEVCIGKGRKQYEVYDINLISLQFHVELGRALCVEFVTDAISAEARSRKHSTR